MKTITDFVKEWADHCPEKPAIICKGEMIPYSSLYKKMMKGEELPIPLLGDYWDGDFCLYTTGTTGKSKGVIISQKAVIANSENLIAGQGYHHNTFFVIAGDMTHLGCWSKIFPVLMQGGTLYILKNGMKDIDAFFRAFETSILQEEILRFATFLVPSNIRILLQFASDRLKLLAGKMEFLETGAAPMPHSDMLQLCELLPNTRLYNTYASTETGIVATHNYNDGRCEVGCLGKPLPHSDIVITPEGHIACSGDTLMSGYKDDEVLTKTILHDGTVFTSDNGFIDDEGRLHILGRDDDIINVGGFKVEPSEVEDVALQIPEIEDCICIARHHPILGLAPSLLVVMKNGCILNKRILIQYIASKLERYKVPLTFFAVEKIERTFNGKLNRKYYNQISPCQK